MKRTQSRILAGAVITGLIIGVALLSSACGGDNGPKQYAFASGAVSGVYYPTAQIIARLANDAHEGFTLKVLESEGSVDNAQALRDGKADIALIQSDIAVYAREGTQGFDKPIPSILGLAALYPEYVQLVALAGSGIESVADLKGKAVALGLPGSGTEQNALQILGAAGLTESDLTRAERLGGNDAVTALREHKVDVAFFTFGVGTPAIEALASSQPVALVPVDGDTRQRLLSQYSYYSEGVVAAGSYSGVDVDVPTVAVTAMLVARKDLPDAVVEALLRAIFSHLDAFWGGRLADMTEESARDNLSIPLHPGAEAFYAGQ